jgi:hypothetical protein
MAHGSPEPRRHPTTGRVHDRGLDHGRGRGHPGHARGGHADQHRLMYRLPPS